MAGSRCPAPLGAHPPNVFQLQLTGPLGEQTHANRPIVACTPGPTGAAGPDLDYRDLYSRNRNRPPLPRHPGMEDTLGRGAHRFHLLERGFFSPDRVGWHMSELDSMRLGLFTSKSADGRDDLHYPVWRIPSESGANGPPAVVYRVTQMALDLDGAPDAYHPPDRNHPNGPRYGGRDALLNATDHPKGPLSWHLDPLTGQATDPNWDLHPAGPGSRWVGVATDQHGRPRVRPDGFYISVVPLGEVNPHEIPYVVNYDVFERIGGVRVGDYAVIVRNAPIPVAVGAVIADHGRRNPPSEGSEALHHALGYRESRGADLVVVMFPRSATNPRWSANRTAADVQAHALSFFNRWGSIAGGLARIQMLFPT